MRQSGHQPMPLQRPPPVGAGVRLGSRSCKGHNACHCSSEQEELFSRQCESVGVLTRLRGLFMSHSADMGSYLTTDLRRRLPMPVNMSAALAVSVQEGRKKDNRKGCTPLRGVVHDAVLSAARGHCSTSWASVHSCASWRPSCSARQTIASTEATCFSGWRCRGIW